MIEYNFENFRVAKNKYVTHEQLYELKDDPDFIFNPVIVKHKPNGKWIDMPEGFVGILVNANMLRKVILKVNSNE